MRIVAWNTCAGLRPESMDRLWALRPDVAVIGEAHRSCPWEATPDGAPIAWDATGIHANRFVAAMGFGEGYDPWPDLVHSGDHCAAIEGPDVGLLAVWSVKRRGGTYAGEVLRILEANADWIRSGRVVVAGDMNIDAQGVGDAPAAGSRRFREVIDTAARLGLVSAYHAFTGEPFGQEKRPTHCFRRNPESTFHIDYCFIPESWADRVTNVEVGAPADWLRLSDHMPLIVDLAEA